VLCDDLIGGLLGRTGVGDIQGNGLGRPAGLGDLRNHGVQGVLPPAGHHYRPTVGS